MKLLSKICLFLSIFSFASLNTEEVKAYTLTKDFSGYYYERDNETKTNYYAGTLKNFLLDGQVAYCIEPGVTAGSTYSTAETWEHSKLAPEIQKDIALYAYYGYDYPGHQKLKYRAATQALIWERILNDKSVVTFSTGEKGTGEKKDVTTEKNEILELVKAHDKVPSFNGESQWAALGNGAVFTDSNGVLNDFEVVSSDGAMTMFQGNNFLVYPKHAGISTIKLRKKSKYQSNFKVFFSKTYQDILVAGSAYPVEATVTVEATGGQIKIEKVDADSLTNKAQGEATLQGAVYEIYTIGRELVTTITTDENGHAETAHDIPIGMYIIKELSPSLGYELDDTEYSVNVTTISEFTVLAKEKVKKKAFRFIKVLSSNQTGQMQPEVGVEFGIFDLAGNLLFQKQTDSEGKVEFELPYGHYVLKQLTAYENYEKIANYYFDVLASGEETKIFADKKISARLKIIKIDAENGKAIPQAHIKFKIFDVQNNKYVTQILSYPEQKVIDVFETDKNGVLLLPYALEAGKYIIEEVNEPILGYLWNNQKSEFTIDENTVLENTVDYGPILTIKFKNTPVKGEITVVKKGHFLDIASGEIKEKEMPLKDVLFGLYAATDIYDGTNTLIYHKDELIKTLRTNEDGLLVFTDLYLGSYYLKELATWPNFVLDETIYPITLEYQDQYTEVVKESLVIFNRAYQGQLLFYKLDGETKEPLKDVLIAIYDENDNLVFQGLTDEFGQIILDLPMGKYYLKEVQTLDNYLLNDEKIYFELKEDGEIITCTLENKREPELIVEVPNTYLDGPNYLYAVMIGAFIYGKKKKNKVRI